MKLRKIVTQLAHEGHLGISHTKNILRSHFWFPRMDDFVEREVRECLVCSSSDKSKVCRRVPLSPVEVPTKPWEKIALDIMGPIHALPSVKRFILVLIEYNSHWVIFRMVSSVTTQMLIEFMKDAIYQEGIPASIVTDNDVQFSLRRGDCF